MVNIKIKYVGMPAGQDLQCFKLFIDDVAKPIVLEGKTIDAVLKEFEIKFNDIVQKFLGRPSGQRPVGGDR